MEFGHDVLDGEQVKISCTRNRFAHLLLYVSREASLIPRFELSGSANEMAKKLKIVPFDFVRVYFKSLLSSFLRPSSLRMWEHELVQYISNNVLSSFMSLRFPVVISRLVLINCRSMLS